MDRLVKITEAAKMLGMSSSTLRRSTILTPIRFGDRKDRRYRLSDIEKLLNPSKEAGGKS